MSIGKARRAARAPAHRWRYRPNAEPAAAAEREPAERDLAGRLITAAKTAARQWGNTTPATDTFISAAASIRAQPKTSVAQRALLEQINWETASPLGSARPRLPN